MIPKKKVNFAIFIIFIVVTLFSINGVSAVSLENQTYLQTSLTSYNFTLTNDSSLTQLNITSTNIIIEGATYLKIKNVDGSDGILNFSNILTTKLLRDASTNALIHDFSTSQDYDATISSGQEVVLLTGSTTTPGGGGGGGTGGTTVVKGDLYRIRVELPSDVDLSNKNPIYVYLEDKNANYLDGTLTATIQGNIGDVDITKKEIGIFLVNAGNVVGKDIIKIDLIANYQGKTLKETIILTENPALNEIENEDLVKKTASGGGKFLKKGYETVIKFIKEKANFLIWLLIILLLILIIYAIIKLRKKNKE